MEAKEKKPKDPKGTVYEPSGKVVQTDVTHGDHLQVENKDGAKWVRNGSDKDPRGAPLE